MFALRLAIAFSALLLLGVAISGAAAARPAMYVVSDLHYDPYYGTALASNAALCGTPEFAALAPFGANECDTPLQLLDSALQDLFTVMDSDDDGIVLVLGDTVRHQMSNFADSSVASSDSSRYYADELRIFANITATIASEIQRYAALAGKSALVHPGVAVIFGNNECVPDYAVKATTNATAHPSLRIFSAALVAADLLSAAEAQQFGQCGFYSRVFPNTNLRILALNTVLYSNENPYPPTMPDPCGQFAWAAAQIAEARAAGQKVILTGHVIPYATRWTASYLATFVEFVTANNDAIALLLFSHTHLAGFQTLAPNASAPMLLDIPAIVPRNANIPSYARLTFLDQVLPGSQNKSAWQIDEMQLRALNIYANGGVDGWQWGLSFPANFSEHLPYPLSNEGLYAYGVRLLGDSKTGHSWTLFQNFHFGGYTETPLGNSDKTKALCAMVTNNYDAYEACKAEYDSLSLA